MRITLSKLFSSEGLAFLSVYALSLALISWIVMLCWNFFLVPAVQGINEIDFITAMGLRGLSGLLFGQIRIEHRDQK